MTPAFERVLLIEDDIININIYERLLTFTGFAEKFIAKKDGYQAKEYLLKNKTLLPDIIFVDLYMHGMNGYEFIEWFQKWCLEENIFIPLYVLSSSMSEDDYNLANCYNTDGYIVKPLTGKHLNEISNKHLAKSRTYLKLS